MELREVWEKIENSYIDNLRYSRLIKNSGKHITFLPTYTSIQWKTDKLPHLKKNEESVKKITKTQHVLCNSSLQYPSMSNIVL